MTISSTTDLAALSRPLYALIYSRMRGMGIIITSVRFLGESQAWRSKRSRLSAWRQQELFQCAVDHRNAGTLRA